MTTETVVDLISKLGNVLLGFPIERTYMSSLAKLTVMEKQFTFDNFGVVRAIAFGCKKLLHLLFFFYCVLHFITDQPTVESVYCLDGAVNHCFIQN